MESPDLSQQRDLSDDTNVMAGDVTATAGAAIGAAVVGPPSAILYDTLTNEVSSNPSTFLWEFDKDVRSRQRPAR